jgi:hypothetical protein
MDWKRKLTSRKFWMCVAAMLASIGSTIAGFHSDNETVVMIGLICTAVSGGIYSVSEALTDAAHMEDTK